MDFTSDDDDDGAGNNRSRELSVSFDTSKDEEDIEVSVVDSCYSGFHTNSGSKIAIRDTTTTSTTNATATAATTAATPASDEGDASVE